MSARRERERINVWRPDDLPGVEVRSGVAVKEPYPRHWHEEYQFCLIQAGGGELFYRGRRHDTPRASLFIVHPGEVHANQTETGCSFRSVYFAPELIRAVVSARDEPARGLPFFPEPIIFDRDVTARYRALHCALETPATTLERETLMLELLARLVERHADARPRPAPAGLERAAVSRVREYLVEHHARNVSLGELARVANLSPFHLTREFAREVGMPPHAFQTQVRVARAKRLIKCGLPLASVAAATGFADQSHFIRQFRRLMKITPGEYLNNCKNV
ncbi:MAG TPA: AraC family transcriptional regulator, partial [Pyrinomonadaceae bacterium]|nr:AraC family transcriptional regulator [Pyrinomonadaceae bacterium]